MSNKKIIIYIAGSILSLFLLTATTYGINTLVEGYRVGKNSETTISAYGLSKTIKNTDTGSDIFVPTSSSNEWNLFLNKAPASFVTVTEGIVIPGTPTIGIATAGNTQASVSFSASTSDGGSAVTGFTVTSTPGGFTGTGLTSPVTVTGLTNGTPYTFTVFATNIKGNSLSSASSNSVTPSTIPGAPTNIVATADNSQATVSFAPTAYDGGSPVTGYTVTSLPAGGVDANAGTTGSSHVITGLTNGTAYTFTVKATNIIGTSVSSGVSNSVTPSTVPDAPTIGTATPGDTYALVYFTPASNGGSAITNYTVTSAPGGLTSTSTFSPIAITGLTNSTSYTFTTVATNKNGDSVVSAASNVVTPAALPGIPALTANTSGTQAVLSWTAPSNGGSAITSYKVYRGLSSGTETLVVAGGCSALGNVLTCTDTGLTDRAMYYYKVAATNVMGDGTQSSEVVAVIANITVVDDATGVGTIAWINTQSALISDNVYASAGNSTYGTTQMTHYLKATNFVFNVPSNATINGITLQVEGRMGPYLGNEAVIKLVKGGVIQTLNKGTNASLGSTDNVITYGGANDLWGTTWTPADINDPSFGTVLSYFGRGYSSALRGWHDYIDSINFLVTYTVGGTSYTVTGYGALASGKDIVSFNAVASIGVIDNINHTVAITVPYGTNITSLSPTIFVSSGAIVSPLSGVAQNFTNPVTYTVTASDGSIASYTVTVAVTPISSAKDITNLHFGSNQLDEYYYGDGYIYGNNVDVVIASTTLTAYPFDISSAMPIISLSSFATINPASGAPQNFTNPIAYTVTAQDGSTKNYTVTVANAPKCGLQTATGIQGYWKFDESLNDTTGIYNGVGTPHYSTEAKVGTSINQGTITVPSFPDLSTFSVGGWVKINDCWSNYPIISKKDVSNKGWSLDSEGLGNAGFNFTFNINGVKKYTSNVYSCGWHHVAFVRGGTGGLMIYVDGQIGSSMNWNGAGDITNLAPLSFYPTGLGQVIIDEAFIFNRDIGQNGAQRIYNWSGASYKNPICRP